MRIRSSTKRLSAALHLISQVTKKAAPELVNRALKDVGFRAMQFTPYAEPGLIQAQLYRDNIAIKLAARRVAQRSGRDVVDRFGNTKLRGRGKAQTFASNRQEIAKEAQRIIAKAVASSRALRAGWIPGLRRVGATVRGAGRLKPGSSASRGTGEKASISKLYGYIQNAVATRSRATGKRSPAGSIRPAIQALQRAVEFVMSDREAYARKKFLASKIQRAAR